MTRDGETEMDDREGLPTEAQVAINRVQGPAQDQHDGFRAPAMALVGDYVVATLFAIRHGGSLGFLSNLKDKRADFLARQMRLELSPDNVWDADERGVA